MSDMIFKLGGIVFRLGGVVSKLGGIILKLDLYYSFKVFVAKIISAFLGLFN